MIIFLIVFSLIFSLLVVNNISEAYDLNLFKDGIHPISGVVFLITLFLFVMSTLLSIFQPYNFIRPGKNFPPMSFDFFFYLSLVTIFLFAFGLFFYWGEKLFFKGYKKVSVWAFKLMSKTHIYDNQINTIKSKLIRLTFMIGLLVVTSLISWYINSWIDGYNLKGLARIGVLCLALPNFFLWIYALVKTLSILMSIFKPAKKN